MKNKLTRGLYDPHNGNPPFWVYGYYTHVAGDAMFPERHIIHTDVGLIDVDPATVGECVAKDKKGRDVYEGDALKQENANGVYVVFYNDKYFRFDVRHTYGFTMELSRLLREYKNETTNLDAEVVGNIHENPALGDRRTWHLLRIVVCRFYIHIRGALRGLRRGIYRADKHKKIIKTFLH